MDANAAGLLSTRRMIDALEAQVGLVRYALSTANVSAPVPSCPGWDVHHLVAHVGTAHRWADRIIEAANPQERIRGLRDIMATAPAADRGSVALDDWFTEGALALLQRVASTDPDAPAWTMDGSGNAGFWLRRQLHETAVHRWDLEHALHPGRETPWTDDVARDGLAEFAMFAAPMAVMMQEEPLPATVRFVPAAYRSEGLASGAAPAGSRDLADPDADHYVLPGAPDCPDITVSGSAEDLMLLGWGRIGVDQGSISVDGDRELLGRILDKGLSV